MSDNDKKPDSVKHETTTAVPTFEKIHTTTITKGTKTYTHSGWTEKEANEGAGDKYNKDEADQKE